jgi:hypothetical protein
MGTKYEHMPPMFNGAATRGARGGLTGAGVAWGQQQDALARGEGRKWTPRGRPEEITELEPEGVSFKELMEMSSEDRVVYSEIWRKYLLSIMLAGYPLTRAELAQLKACELVTRGLRMEERYEIRDAAKAAAGTASRMAEMPAAAGGSKKRTPKKGFAVE